MCGDCHHFFLSPTFSDDEIARFYSKEMIVVTHAEYAKCVANSGKSWAAHHGIAEERQLALLAEARDFCPAFLHKFVAKSSMAHVSAIRKILDVGSMDGTLTSRFEAADQFVFDINPRKEAPGNVRFLSSKLDIEREGPFDLLVMSHVLEHQPRPREFLETYWLDVAESGLVYLEVPLEYMAPYVRRRPVIIGGHIQFFSRRRRTVCECSQRAGTCFLMANCACRS